MSTEKKLTAVEWLFDEMLKGKFDIKEIINQAKEMHKQQIIDAGNKWIYTTNQLPICFETGNWDGKKSEPILAETIKGKQFIAECYEGQMDGSNFFDWYFVDTISKNDWLVNDTVVRWQKITD